MSNCLNESLATCQIVLQYGTSFLYSPWVRLKQLANHVLGNILFSIQLLVTHLVTTFCVGDYHDIPGIYLACGPKHQNKHSFSFCLLWLSVGSNRAFFVLTTRKHRISPMTHHHDDHWQKMSRPSDWPRVGSTNCHQACYGRTNRFEYHLLIITIEYVMLT